MLLIKYFIQNIKKLKYKFCVQSVHSKKWKKNQFIKSVDVAFSFVVLMDNFSKDVK